MKNRIIAVTGANGFVGSALCKQLELRGYFVRRLVRKSTSTFENEVSVGDIDGNTDWNNALKQVTTVIHCAARAHLLPAQDSTDDFELYRKINTLGTLNLAKKAAANGVKRFIFLSSIKVNGEASKCLSSFGGVKNVRPFTHLDVPSPNDDYSTSKWNAEQGLRKISLETGMEIVIVRSPLVYGPGVKANFLRLLKLAQKGCILPFGNIKNKRSLIGLFNLVDFLICCIWNSAASNNTFLVSDGQDLSTPELLRKISDAFALNNISHNKRVILLPVPVWVLRFIFLISRQSSLSIKLIDSLRVDITHTREILGWSPPQTVEECLLDAVKSFK